MDSDIKRLFGREPEEMVIEIERLRDFKNHPFKIRDDLQMRSLKDDEAVIAMVDANNQREKVSLSEKAFAYKMKYEAMKRSSGNKKQNGSQIDYPVRGRKTVEILGEGRKTSAPYDEGLRQALGAVPLRQMRGSIL